MPAETKRLQRRITPRDRWFFALLACAALIGTPAAVVLSTDSSQPSVGARCVTVMRASIMGGATYKYCDADRVAACRQFANDHKELAAQCEELGLMQRHRGALAVLAESR